MSGNDALPDGWASILGSLIQSWLTELILCSPGSNNVPSGHGHAKIAFGARPSAHGLLSCTAFALWMLGGTHSRLATMHMWVLLCARTGWVNVDPLWVALMPKSKKKYSTGEPHNWNFLDSQAGCCCDFFVYRQANITYDFSVGVSCCRVVCLSKLAEMNQKVLGTALGVSKSLGTPINL